MALDDFSDRRARLMEALEVARRAGNPTLARAVEKALAEVESKLMGS